MIDWALQPLIGFGPLRFGMTRLEVNQLLGPPRYERRFSDEDHRESRGKGSSSYDVILGYAYDKLMSATFPFQESELSIFDLNVFEEKPNHLIEILKHSNGGLYTVHGSTISFNKLGIALNDWMESDVSDKWLAAMSVEDYEKFASIAEPDEIVK